MTKSEYIQCISGCDKAISAISKTLQSQFQSIKSIDKSASIDSDFNLKSTLPNDNILKKTYESILVSLNNIKSHRETYLELLNNLN